MSSAARRAQGSQQQSSAFTSPPPAIARELLNLDALSPNALQAAAAAATPGHATTPPPVAPPPGKATPWTPNGPNNTHVPYLRVKLHPMFADLLDPAPAKKAREAAPAWRPGGSSKKQPGTAAAAAGPGAPAAFSTPPRKGGAALQQRVPASAPSALESITARARATSRQTAAAYASQLDRVTPTRHAVEPGALSGRGSPTTTAAHSNSGAPTMLVAQQQRQQQPTYEAANLGHRHVQAAAAAAAQRGLKVPVPPAALPRTTSPSPFGGTPKTPVPVKASPVSPPPSRGRGRPADPKPLSYAEWAQSQQHQPQKQRQQQQQPASQQAHSPVPGQAASPRRKATTTQHAVPSPKTVAAAGTPPRPSSSPPAVPLDTHDPSFSGILGPRVHQGHLEHLHRHSPAAATLAQLPPLRSPRLSSRGSSTAGAADAAPARMAAELSAEAAAAGVAAERTGSKDDIGGLKRREGAVGTAGGVPASGVEEGEGARERGAGRAGGGGVTAAAARGGGTGGAGAGMGSGHLRSHSLYDPQLGADHRTLEEHTAAGPAARDVGAVRGVRGILNGPDEYGGDDDDDYSHEMTDGHAYGGYGDEYGYGLGEPQGGNTGSYHNDRDDYSDDGALGVKQAEKGMRLLVAL